MTPASAPRSYLCTGKDCRRATGHRELLTVLREVSDVTRVPCQDLCDGPVAGVAIDGRVEWFEKVRKDRHRRAVVAIVQHPTTKVPGALKDRWAKKRSGKIAR